ncbi:MAG TPA: transcriptional regulator [Actinomycetota bacterium]|nr:transcriptional regulator [Actinomycetota bacterium]
MNIEAVKRVAVLADGLRSRMYGFIRERRLPVTRDEAAAAVGISRKLAAFHLDKLVAAGLLDAHYAHPPGRGGPGAGRTSKLYQPSDVEIQLSLPQRHYDICAEILLDALQTLGADEAPEKAVIRVASAYGRALGEDVRGRQNRASINDPIFLLIKVLRELGFEPYLDEDDRALRLHNCPFKSLAQRSPAVVCGMNRSFIEGLVKPLAHADIEVILEPRPGECCVAVLDPKRA